jgi:hypothetical protein
VFLIVFRPPCNSRAQSFLLPHPGPSLHRLLPADSNFLNFYFVNWVVQTVAFPWSVLLLGHAIKLPAWSLAAVFGRH